MKPENLEAVYRLSPSQEGILFHTLYEPASSLYFLQLAVTVRGRLDAGVLRGAWEDLVARHPALRTEIHWQGLEKPVQVVQRRVALVWQEEDWTGVPERAREERLARFREADRERGFDLSQAPLLRLTLIRAAEDLCYFVWSFHHVVIDGWCLPIVFQEVFDLYTARLRGEKAQLPPVRPYRDYIAWLQRQLAQSTEAFWRESLAGFTAPTPLAAGLPAAPAASREFGELESELSPEVSAALSGLARRRRLTPSALLQAAWGLLLGRYADVEDVVFGATFSGRSAPVPGIESMVGLFINTLPVRVRLSGDAAVGPWLQEIGDRHAQLVHREHSPLVEVQGWSEVPRGVPLFESLLVLENYPMDRAAGALAKAVPFTIEMAPIVSENNYPLAFVVFAGERYLLRLKHETRRFGEDVAARLLGHVESLLEAIASAPDDLPLRDLPMLREAERRQLLREWQEPGPEVPARTLTALFADQVERAPERAAVTHEGRSWTYRELDARANRIARALIDRGVRPGGRVALCLERSLDLPAAILGVLKTGAAYVPIDPVHPEERRRYVLADSGASGLVTDAATAGLWNEIGVWKLSLDSLTGDADDPRLDLSPDLPAYVIYTSGSTGQPKGVLVTHRNVARLLASSALRFDFGPQDVWTLFHSYAFDFSVWEMWGALLHGGRLVVVPYWTSRSPRDFDALLREEGVTVLNQTPSAFLAWMAEESGGSALRWVIFGGEALEPATLAPWFERGRSARLVNMYGITETTVHVTFQALGAGRDTGIGLPLPGWSAHVLNRSLEPLPVGVPGEICVGGDGVAVGYLGQAERTAERFVPDPFATEPGARLYRSGDLARRRPDGVLEYLGRIDRQVKIRGFRIELGEIEAALARHPAIREAVVEVRRDRAGEPLLVAWIVLAAGEAMPELAELRSFLAPFLPEYMLPGALVVLSGLPLTANGKVDRRALPEPEAPRGASEVEPRTPLEAFLAGLWRETLGVERVGVHDDFFALGGSSISGARLVNRLQKHLGEIVHVVAIFDAPTVAKLAAHLAAEHREAVERVWGGGSVGEVVVEARIEKVEEEAIAEFLRNLQSLPAVAASVRNPSAVFVLSPPRSGSTLLRVMLGGHPRLFAPPELELLSFSTLEERRRAFAGRDAFWLEGLIRAVKEALGCDAGRAREVVVGWEDEGLGTLAAYGRLQALIGEQRLVDKTPSYALVPGALRRAEEGFEAPFYIHLVRHPAGMIRSFDEAKLDQLVFRREHSYSRRELAELIWVASHRRILDHLATVPPERQARVRFEDLVAAPERTLRELCGRLGLDFDPAMARPYDDLGRRMADGLHAESRVLGDVKLAGHCAVDPAVADRWRADLSEADLGGPARELAVRFGYEQAPAPLSFPQERLWFLDRLMPGSPAYNIPVSVRLTGQLDVHALAASLREVVRRHEVLRTRFDEEDGRAVQRVGDAVEVPLPVVDLAALPSARGLEETRRLAAEEASRGFDLSRGPLLRAALVRLDGREHVALFTMHHIVSDGWSMGILIREVGALYAAFTSGRPSPLPPLRLQYADFARWQRTSLSFEADLGYWRHRLEGAPAELELPADRPRPAVATGAGGERSIGLSASAVAALARDGATPFMALLAGWNALLHRLTGETDLLVGTPVANRNRAELEELIGFFVNTLVVCTNLAGDLPFRGLVERTRDAAVGAFAHQDLPFEKLVEALAPERSLARTPFFQVMLALQNAPFEELSLPGLALSPFPAETPAAKFDLSLLAAARGEEILLSLTFSRDLFDEATAEHLLRAYVTLVEAAASLPEARVADLPLLTEGERDQLLREWSDPAEPVDALVPELFRRQAERTPDAVAVRQDGATVTYRELAETVERLARGLRALDVGPEARVGLFLDRSPETVTALLGVLAAGGAFVPLDPELPAERLAFLLEDAGVARILTAGRLLGALKTALPVHTVEDLTTSEADEALAPVLADAAAYVLHTSGSTGRPKGVVIGHRSLANYLSWIGGFLADQGVEALPALSRLSFDAFLKQLLAPLLRGGEVWLFSDSDPDRLLSALGSREGTAFNGVPALWRALLERIEAGAPAPRTLRAVLLGGDRVSPDLVARTAAAFPQVAVWNLYGPTEATANATAGRLGIGVEPALGRPVAGARVHVLDRGLQPLPPGVPGEICIGGAGLARGYDGLPALTAERFVPAPSGGRLYRTGDRARLRPDGALEFLGRLDHQIKVRGVRIEPGEVEAALASHPAVREAVAGARRGPDGEEALAAWFVPRDAAPTVSELKEHLRRRLPEAFVPSWLVAVAELPRTPSGKIDRAALPDPQVSVGEAVDAAPRGPAEEMLVGIWEDLFQRSGISTADDFFDLGGHSLLAVRLASRIRHAFGFEMPLRTVFEHPTIAGLAAALDARVRGVLEPEPPIARALLNGPLPLSFPQQRLWILDRIEPGSPVYNMPLPIVLEGDLDGTALARALGEILRRHEVLRTRYAAGPDGEPEQIVEPPALGLPRVDLRGLPESAREIELRRLGEAEARRPFDLGRAPMLRATLVELEQSRLLLLTLHHIAADGWSLEVLLREASALYTAFVAGEPSPLAEPEIQYADYAVWQRRRLEEIDGLTSWWRERLSGAAPFELTPDRPRPAAPDHRGARVPLQLSPGLTASLREAGRREGATLFMVGLAGFQALLARTTGRRDGVLGSPTANRDRREIEGLIGFFVNMLVLRGTVVERESFSGLMARVRETALGAYAHRELPFERLVEALHPERDPGRNPLFQIVFQLLPAARAARADGLGLRRLELERGTTQFDLGLSWIDDGQGLAGTIEYATDLYDRTTVLRFAESLVRLLEGVAVHPGADLDRISLLSPAEEHQVLCEWNDTAGADTAVLVHRLFEERAAAAPEAVALLYRDETVTYGELNRRANRIAHRLRRQGVGPEAPVAVLLDRSAEQITAFLAVLKAGGAYAPLDPSYPAERLALLLEDLGGPLVLTSGDLQMAEAEDESTENPDPGPLSGSSLVYILYTSGSTGRPKGVAAVHESVIRLVRGGFMDLGPEETFLHLSHPSFDASTLEIWAPLLHGGRLAILPAGTPSLEDLAGAIARHGVTSVWLTAGLFRVVVDRDLETLRPLRQVITGGDVVPLPQALRVLEELPGCRLYNGYGPTENTTFTTVHPISSEDARRGSVPIGRPIDGGRVMILDGTFPAPVGVPGELCAGGLGLARGYFGRPDLTAERFVPDPSGVGERLYRTGDLARWLPAGSVEFLGRIDAQVKIRGFRIEPGEVESVLAGHPGVETAAVAVRLPAGTAGDKRLVAWFVPSGTDEVSAADLRAWLKSRLPEFMVPAAFVPIPALPLTANGKVDRAALPEPEAEKSEGGAPRTPAEQVLASIWSELLGVPSVGLEDDFFELGGHSLLAIQLVSRVRETLGVEIPLRALFERPTLAGMAGEIAAGQGVAAPPVVPVSRDEPLPLSYAQQRLWILDQMEIGLTAYNLPLAVRLAGDLDIA
ncbi:MAG: amino acid adenylation domain-containing protein, partial [Acidobacteriota bacterium]